METIYRSNGLSWIFYDGWILVFRTILSLLKNTYRQGILAKGRYISKRGASGNRIWMTSSNWRILLSFSANLAKPLERTRKLCLTSMKENEFKIATPTNQELVVTFYWHTSRVRWNVVPDASYSKCTLARKRNSPEKEQVINFWIIYIISYRVPKTISNNNRTAFKNNIFENFCKERKFFCLLLTSIRQQV